MGNISMRKVIREAGKELGYISENGLETEEYNSFERSCYYHIKKLVANGTVKKKEVKPNRRYQVPENKVSQFVKYFQKYYYSDKDRLEKIRIKADKLIKELAELKLSGSKGLSELKQIEKITNKAIDEFEQQMDPRNLFGL